MSKQVFRLAGLMAAMGLATSRIGLIGHELVGHGGLALAAGGHITHVRLFWFGGGWLRYSLPGQTTATVIAIMMAGIAFELVVGTALWLGGRGPALTRRITRGVGQALVVHATWYLAIGTFSGMGDGLILYHQLGDARVPLAIAAGLITCTAVFLGARSLTAPLARTLPGSPRQRALGFAIATLLGGGLHAALTVGEMQLRRDATYTQMMQPERDRQIAAAVAKIPDPDAQRVERVRLERAHPKFPFSRVLALAALASLIAGIARSRGGSEERLSNPLLVRAVILALVSIFAVVLLDGLLPG